MAIFKKVQKRIQGFLSHYPIIYALVVGVGIVLFWRGVWHGADEIHSMFANSFYNNSSMSLDSSFWWDAPFSFLLGFLILSITGAFTSSFIGNELILSGLRGERKLSERTEHDVKNEINTISDIKEELILISKKLESLEKRKLD